MSRIVREPLVHFVLLGAVLYAVHGWVAGAGTEPADGDRTIVVSSKFVEGLRQQHVRRTGKTPDAEQERALVEGWAEREALYREARRLGLGKGDPIVRRRLVQKMQLALEASADLPEPTSEQLGAHLREHAGRFRRPARIAFSHVYFDDERREDARADARAVLTELRASDAPASAASDHGDGFALSHDFGLTPVERVRRTFGPGFVEGLDDAEIDRWHGPVDSSYGLHLVHVQEREPERAPELAEVRERVRRDWLANARERAIERATEELRERYEVVRRDDAPKVAETSP